MIVRRYLIVASAAAVMGAALAGIVLVALLPGEIPTSLASPSALGTVQPSYLRFSDEREVTVTLVLDTSAGLRSPRDGILTALDCTPGQIVSSGSSSMSIGGSPVRALSTTTPLWRDIVIGDDGADVAALTSELVRLGASLDAEGEWNWSDARAFDALMDPVTTDEDGTVALASLAWLPAPAAVIASCPIAVGTTTTSGEVAIAFAPRIAAARYSPPEGAVEGERQLVLGGVTIPAPDDGVIVARAALDSLATSMEFQQRDTTRDPPAITAMLALATPVAVTVLPPSAVYGLSGEVGCVRDEVGSVGVTVIASQLGRTLVVADRRVGAVSVHPDAGDPCR